MISRMVELSLALFAGAGFGTFYFAGLWWTVRKLPSAQNPSLLSLGSFLLRTAVVLAGFYLAMGGQWDRLAACLVGFMTARFAVVKCLKPSSLTRNRLMLF